jgi:hypothetical protein
VENVASDLLIMVMKELLDLILFSDEMIDKGIPGVPAGIIVNTET